MKKNLHFIWLIIAVGFFGCGRKGDFLYHYVRPEEPVYASLHKLRELQGDRDVDILWVIDNSGSMDDDQQVVIANTKLFVDELTQNTILHWNMGLISTDETEEPYIGLAQPFTYQDTNIVDKFQHAVGKLGTMGSGIETFMDSASQNLGRFPGFIRRNAWLAIIVVSDAPEQSKITAAKFLAEISALKGGLQKVLFYGVLWPKELCVNSSFEEDFMLSGSAFEEILKSVKGNIYPLCDPLFGKYLPQMSRDIVSRVEHPSILLKKRPIVSTIVVNHQGTIIKGGDKLSGGFWLYNFDSNSIVFHDLSFAASDTEEIEVTFKEDLGIAP